MSIRSTAGIIRANGQHKEVHKGTVHSRSSIPQKVQKPNARSASQLSYFFFVTHNKELGPTKKNRRQERRSTAESLTLQKELSQLRPRIDAPNQASCSTQALGVMLVVDPTVVSQSSDTFCVPHSSSSSSKVASACAPTGFACRHLAIGPIITTAIGACLALYATREHQRARPRSR